MGNSTDYHEPYESLPEEVREIHRATASLMEELEAVDWYNQRAAVTTDDSLKRILEHNRDEEIEHAAMALEWLRRRMPKLDEELRTYLFTDADVTEIEEVPGAAEAPPEPASASAGLGIGSLQDSKDERTG